ncbi:biotin/lipoyl-binding carrier protein [Mariniluteicoccus endophyticus]
MTAAAPDRSAHTVTAELVASVMKVEVAIGDRVTPTDPVVVLESMKMEIPVLAEKDGIVREVVVTEGDVVRDGDPLVVLTIA